MYLITRDEYLYMYELVGAAMEVYNTLGRGMQEPIYQEAMQHELALRKMPFEREKVLHTWYKGIMMEKTYVADFVSNDIIVEFKSVSEVTSDHRAQLFNYMRITKMRFGVLVNFGEPHFHSERYVFDESVDQYVLISKQNYLRLVEP